jgi:hypothetical protein
MVMSRAVFAVAVDGRVCRAECNAYRGKLVPQGYIGSSGEGPL